MYAIRITIAFTDVDDVPLRERGGAIAERRRLADVESMRSERDDRVRVVR
jgi:hypothetical protein